MAARRGPGLGDAPEQHNEPFMAEETRGCPCVIAPVVLQPLGTSIRSRHRKV